MKCRINQSLEFTNGEALPIECRRNSSAQIGECVLSLVVCLIIEILVLLPVPMMLIQWYTFPRLDRLDVALVVD